MKFYKSPSILQKTIPSVWWTGPAEQNQIYLTFDDGPTPEITPWVLDVLDQHNAKATFFCLGKNVEQHPVIFQRILEEGHSVGNHTYNHPKGRQSKTSDYLENILKAEKSIQSKLFRPPYGSLKLNQFRALKKEYQIVMWDLLSYDFDPQVNIQKSIEKLQQKAKAGSIIVFHDSEKAFPQLKQMLPELLAHWSKAYTFAPLKY